MPSSGTSSDSSARSDSSMTRIRALWSGRLLSTTRLRTGDTTGVSSPSRACRSVPPASGVTGPGFVQPAVAPTTAHNFTTFQMRIGRRTLACLSMADTFRFRNLDGSGPTPFRRVFRWVVLDRLTGRRRRSPARAPVPEVQTDVEVLRRPPLDGLRLTWLGHASWLVQGAGTSVLIDPVLGPRISGVIRRNAGPGLTVEQLPRIDASLVTHNHYDHLDLPTLRAVQAPVVAGTGTHANLKGLPSSELAWWNRLRVGGLTITFVPGQPWSSRGWTDVQTHP